MQIVETPRGPINYRIVDQTAPWIEAPETIVFHHGVGASAGCWAGWFQALSERYRLVAYDLPGHGGSPQWQGGITMDELAGLVMQVADVAGAGRFHLVGESIGGTVALQVAAGRGDRLASLTVSNGAHLGASIQNLANWQRIIDEEGMAGWSRMMMERRFRDGALPQPLWDWYCRQQAEADGATVLALAAALVGTDLGEAVRGIAVPTLLLHPDASPFIPVPAMADLHARIPGARLRIFPHAKHGLPFSHARECAATVSEFLSEIGRN